MTKKLLIILGTLFLIALAHSQDYRFMKFTDGKVYGILFSYEKQEAVPYAHIINTSKNYAVISDSIGAFRIRAEPDDTLLISAIGFKTEIIVVKPDLSAINEFNFIWMSSHSYEINEVTIFSLGSWQDFKNNFMELEVKEEFEELKEEYKELAYKTALESYNVPMGISLNFDFKRNRQLQELEEIIQRERRQRVIEKKFNRQIVSRVTGLQGEELTRFIAYCNFSEIFLYASNQYDIIVAVLIYYENYKRYGNVRR